MEPETVEQQRVNGVALEWRDDRAFGIVAEAGGNRFVCIQREIPCDGIGRRYLQEGESVSFLPALGLHGRTDRAREVRFLSRPLYERFPADYHEEITLTSWDEKKGFGFARRVLGGSLFVNRAEIITEGVETLKPGSKLWTAIRRSDDPQKCWRAVSVEICLPETTDATKKTKAILTERATEPMPEFLSGLGRQKTPRAKFADVVRQQFADIFLVQN